MLVLMLHKLIGVLCAMVLLWALSVRLKRMAILDIFWGLAIIAIAIASTVQGPADLRSLLLCAAVGVWGLRLSLHLALRQRKQGEDKRYAHMLKKRGEHFRLRSLYSVFFVQGVLLWLITLPIQRLALEGSEATWLPSDIAGASLMSLGLLIEVVADAQLALFGRKPENKTKVLHHGLWRYSRHPNYFGEWLFWWGVFIVSLASGATWTMVSPLLLTGLLLHVSGIRPLERTITARRPEYQQYIEQTSAFIPWFAPAQLDENPQEP